MSKTRTCPECDGEAMTTGCCRCERCDGRGWIRLHQGSSDIEEAIALATLAHRGQRDKGGRPYLIHALSVMHRVRDTGGDEFAQIVAVLHDTVEDTHLTLLEIKELFGTPVATAVDALTRRPDEPYKQYVLRVAENPTAIAVKIADLRDNMDPRRRSWVKDGPYSAEWARLERRYLDAIRVLQNAPASQPANAEREKATAELFASLGLPDIRAELRSIWEEMAP